jgi:hypothetical protein
MMRGMRLTKLLNRCRRFKGFVGAPGRFLAPGSLKSRQIVHFSCAWKWVLPKTCPRSPGDTVFLFFI